jgi:ribosomal protein L16/L10AE
MSKNTKALSKINNSKFKIVKQHKKSSKNKKKKITILGRPVHFIRPKGVKYNFKIGYKVLLKSKTWGLVTEAQIKSFKRFLFITKRFKRRIVCSSYPYHEMTKKPSEVRMGKGHGRKILRRVSLSVPGKLLFEAFLPKHAFHVFKKAPVLLKRAVTKMSLPIRVTFNDL